MSLYNKIDAIVEVNIEQISKLKKNEIIAFAKSLLKDYYLELDPETINEVYNEQVL